MVIWTQPAKADLRNIHDFIACDSKFYAKKTIQDIIEKTDILEAHPFIGRAIPELNDKAIREIAHLSYRIIYQLLDEQIYILVIAHKRQNLKSLSTLP